MATNANQPAAREGQGGGSRLIFPNHLAELINQDTGHPFVLLLNNEDDSEIALPIPESINLADGANYEGLDRADFKTAESFGEGTALSEADQLALGLRAAKNLPGLDKITQDQFLRKRMAVNPMTEMTFTGMNMRTLGLAFELLPRNEKEAVTIRNIEAKLRKMMYPMKTGDTGYTVRYPNMFTVMFMAGEKESRFFPIIHHAYLSSMSTDFRGQSGAYLKVKDDFMGQKHKLDLTFTEAKMLTRNDIEALDDVSKKSTHKDRRGKMEGFNDPIVNDSQSTISDNTPAKKD